MKLYDFFMFNGENELLEIRLNTLDSIVDNFIIGNCEYSHSGIKKGLNNIPTDLMEKFGHKIILIEIPYINHNNPWVNEMNGRQYPYDIMKEQLKPDDLLLVCDLDEIPRPEKLIKISKNLTTPVTFCGDYFLFCLNLWGRKSIDGFLIKNEWVLRLNNLNWCRSHRTNFQYNIFKHIPDASWHFSSCMTPENIAKKMSYFGHCNEFTGEVRNPEYLRKIIQGKCANFKLDEPNFLIEKEVDILPEYVRKHQEKFKHLLYNHYK